MALAEFVALTVKVGAGRLSNVGDTSKKLTVCTLPPLSATTDLPLPGVVGPTVYTSDVSMGALGPAVCCRMVWLKPSSPGETPSSLVPLGQGSAAFQSMPLFGTGPP